jgi:hypothetical protein
MSASIAATFYNIGYAQTVAQSMEQNQVDVLVLTPNQYMSILQDKAKNNPRLEYTLREILAKSSFGQYWNTTFSPNANQPWVGPVSQFPNDAYMIAKTFHALGVAGLSSYIKRENGNTWIILKGFAGLRGPALQGTRYSATNPKMIKLGLGIKGAGNVAKGGFILGVVVSSGIEVADFIFNDEKTMYDLVGGIGVEAVKAGLATMVGLAAAGFGAATGIAVAPLIGLVAVTLVVGYLLNVADDHYKIKKRVIEALKTAPEQTAQGIYMINTEAESWLARVKASVEVKQQEVGRAVHQGVMDWLCPVCRRY